MSSSKRVYYYDFLRIISISAVVLIHVSASALHHYDIGSFEWGISNLYSSVSRFAVPVFVMISGALFLDRDISIKTIYKKNILRLLLAYISFYILYNIYEGIENGRRVASIIKRMIFFNDIPYHLWFIVMLIGLYMIIPFLRLVISNPKLSHYFCVLSLLFSFALPQALSMLNTFLGDQIAFINTYFNDLNLFLPLGYSGYFVLGYLLSKTNISKRAEVIIYVFGLIGIVSTFFYQQLNDSLVKQEALPLYDYSNLNLRLNVLFEAVAVFVLAKNHFIANSEIAQRAIHKISGLTFGVYLIHLMFIYILEKHFSFLSPLEMNPAFSILIATIIVLFCSFAVAIVLKTIPIVKDYIV